MQIKSETTRMSINAFVPGGIKASDHLHRVMNDGTCSRCRNEVSDEHVPLLLWVGDDGRDMYIFCEECLAKEAS